MVGYADLGDSSGGDSNGDKSTNARVKRRYRNGCHMLLILTRRARKNKSFHNNYNYNYKYLDLSLADPKHVAFNFRRRKNNGNK